MTALTLTPDHTAGTVRITITGAPDGPVTIIRADTAGTTPVRLRAGEEPIAGAMIVDDYEPATVGPISYAVTDSASVTTTAMLAGDLAPSAVFLGVPVLPQYALTAAAVTDLDADRESGTVIHDVIDRADPIATLAPLRMRSGTLAIWCPDAATARAVDSLAQRPDVLHLRGNPAGDLYLVVTRSRTRHDSRSHEWSCEVVYREVARPTGPLLGGAGWTFRTVAARTFRQVRADFATMADLRVGP